MNLIYILDQNGGMMFNHRRQSKDKTLIEDVVNIVSKVGGTLWLTEYSKKLFGDFKLKVDNLEKLLNSPLDNITDNDFLFIEDSNFDFKTFFEENPSFNKRFLIYTWDRTYPYDKQFDLSYFSLNEFKLKEARSFSGNSHDKIMLEIFEKKGVTNA